MNQNNCSVRDDVSDALALPPDDESRPVERRLDRYVLFDQINRPYLTWQLDQFRQYLGQRILEIGCGVGGIINQLRPRELIVGLDVEPDVLDYVRQRFQGCPECRFELLDIADADLDKLASRAGASKVCGFQHLEKIGWIEGTVEAFVLGTAFV